MQRKGVSPVLAKLSHVNGCKPVNHGVVLCNKTQLAATRKRPNHSENESTNQPKRNMNLCSLPGTIQERNDARNAERYASCVSQQQEGRRKERVPGISLGTDIAEKDLPAAIVTAPSTRLFQQHRWVVTRKKGKKALRQRLYCDEGIQG